MWEEESKWKKETKKPGFFTSATRLMVPPFWRCVMLGRELVGTTGKIHQALYWEYNKCEGRIRNSSISFFFFLLRTSYTLQSEDLYIDFLTSEKVQAVITSNMTPSPSLSILSICYVCMLELLNSTLHVS